MNWLSNIYKSKVAKNSIIYTTDFTLQIFVQASYVVLISRHLGPHSYGVFASIIAITIIISMFAGFGSDQILIKNTAENKRLFQKSFGKALLLTLISFPVLLIITIIILISIDEIQKNATLLSLLLFSTYDLFFTKIFTLCKSCFLAFGKAKNQLLINIVNTVIKLTILILSINVSENFNLDVWAIWYFFGGLISMLFAFCNVIYFLSRPSFVSINSDLKLGIQFCIEQASLAGLKDLDKPIVASMLGAEFAGYYSVAFKIVDAASTPVRGLLTSLYVKFFSFGVDNKKSGINFAFKTLPFLGLGSIVIGILLYFFSFFIPEVLGYKYEMSVDIVKSLCLYPLLLGLLGLGSDLLRGIGYQSIRTSIMLIFSVLTAPVVYVFILFFNGKGVVTAKIFLLLSVVLIIWFFILKIKRKT